MNTLRIRAIFRLFRKIFFLNLLILTSNDEAKKKLKNRKEFLYIDLECLLNPKQYKVGDVVNYNNSEGVLRNFKIVKIELKSANGGFDLCYNDNGSVMPSHTLQLNELLTKCSES